MYYTIRIKEIVGTNKQINIRYVDMKKNSFPSSYLGRVFKIYEATVILVRAVEWAIFT